MDTTLDIEGDERDDLDSRLMNHARFGIRDVEPLIPTVDVCLTYKILLQLKNIVHKA